LARQTIRVGDFGEQGVDVGAVVLLRRRHRCRSHAQRVDRIHQEAELAVQQLIARPGIGAHQEIDQLVGARAADDALGVEAVVPADRRPQLGRIAVRIAVDLGGHLGIGRHRLG